MIDDIWTVCEGLLLKLSPWKADAFLRSRLLLKSTQLRTLAIAQSTTQLVAFVEFVHQAVNVAGTRGPCRVGRHRVIAARHLYRCGERGDLTIGKSFERDFQGVLVNAKSDKTLNEIEASQTAMRESVEVTIKLSAETDRLIKRHRKELEEDN